MAAKLGSTDVSFRLGAGEVAAVYLGTQEVWSAVPPEPATLYFNNAASDGAWTTVGNWWLDDGHTEPAGRLPNSVDSVVVTESITASGQTVVDFTIGGNFVTLGGTLTVTGMATFNDGSYNSGTVTGNATFNNSFNNGTVNGDATFNGSSSHSGTVTGNATFNDSSSNFGTVTGTATFNDSACNSDQFGTAGTFVPDPPPSCNF
jgi:hypothetical protein